MKIRLLPILITAATASSCGLDPHVITPEDWESDEQTALRLKYTERLCGEWENADTTENSRMYEYVKFISDARAVHIAKVEYCDFYSTGTDGNKTFHAGWETVQDDTLDGRWFFSVIDGDTTLHIPGCGETKFYGIDGDTLRVNIRMFNKLVRIDTPQSLSE